jgi:hypothetical protein
LRSPLRPGLSPTTDDRTFAVVSHDPETKRLLLLGWTERERTSPPWSEKRCTSFCCDRSQKMHVLSPLAVSRLPRSTK